MLSVFKPIGVVLAVVPRAPQWPLVLDPRWAEWPTPSRTLLLQQKSHRFALIPHRVLSHQKPPEFGERERERQTRNRSNWTAFCFFLFFFILVSIFWPRHGEPGVQIKRFPTETCSLPLKLTFAAAIMVVVVLVVCALFAIESPSPPITHHQEGSRTVVAPCVPVFQSRWIPRPTSPPLHLKRM